MSVVLVSFLVASVLDRNLKVNENTARQNIDLIMMR